MSNQSFTDKQLINMSLDEIKKIIKQEKRDIKKDYDELEKKRELIEEYKKLTVIREKVKKGKVVSKQKTKPKTKPKPKPKVVLKKTSKNKPKVVSKPNSKNNKTFEDYFEECIKNRRIPKDTPSYLRKALERAIKEYDQGIEIEKSALNQFAKKYIIKGEPGILPDQFFENKKHIINDFLKNHRNNKVRFVLNTVMKKKEKLSKDSEEYNEVRDKAYFNSSTYNNYKSTNVKKLLRNGITNINESVSKYQINGSGWTFDYIEHLEIQLA